MFLQHNLWTYASEEIPSPHLRKMCVVKKIPPNCWRLLWTLRQPHLKKARCSVP